MNAFGLAPLLLVFPVIGLLFNALVGRRFVQPDYYRLRGQLAPGEPIRVSNDPAGEKWSGWVASLMALGSFAVALLLLLSLAGNGFHAERVLLFDWIRVPAANFHVPWAMQIDTLSVTMMLVVSGVGALIHIYAIGYMHGDPDFSRFFVYMNLFLFFMLILVSADNYLMLFVGWEGVGLCSFLLIGFWFDQVANSNAARKAFVANRVGDFAMILALILLFIVFGSLGFDTIFDSSAEMFAAGHTIPIFGQEYSIGALLSAVTILFLIGATGKSAQIPLYVWLPDAMAGPTPVSALIHAATMVTSGIYLIVRSNVLFEIVREAASQGTAWLNTPDVVAYIGAATALLAGLIAFTQFDIKKVLAYSTISQLGFMVAAVGMGAYVAGMFHLITHAFFKALLFLGSGSVIHGMEHGHHHLLGGDHGHPDEAHDAADEHALMDHHEDQRGFDPQDMRFMGNLRERMPTTFSVFLIGALALAGIPPLAGFWSKDEILGHGQAHNLGIYIILTLAAVATAFYMGRQIKMVFFGEPRHEAAAHAQESPPLMTRPLIILAALAAFGGALNIPFLSEGLAARYGNHPGGIFLALEGWLEHSLAAFALSEEGLFHLPHTPLVLSPSVALISTGLAVAAFALAFWVVYARRPQTASDPDPMQRTPIWWFGILPLNTLYMRLLVPLFNRFAGWLAYRVDWAFWHDFVHNNIIRDMFVGFAGFASSVFDRRGIDRGLVHGAARAARGLADVIRVTQTGYVRNYALGLFVGVVALLAYFLLYAG